jgi:predicted ATP-dependent serine protease
MFWRCFRCGLEWNERIAPGVCPRCGAVESYDRPLPYESPKRVAELQAYALPMIPTGEPLLDDALGGGFVFESRVMLWGKGGTGKSRLAMRWASGSEPALYVSLEMLQPIAVSTARSCGANLQRLFITESPDDIARSARECGARIAVLDSISVVPRHEQAELLAEIKDWVRKVRGVAIVLCHQNKRGLHAGSHAIQHWGDYELFTRHAKGKNGTLVDILKSRACPLSTVRTTLGPVGPGGERYDPREVENEGREDDSDDYAEHEDLSRVPPGFLPQ